MSLRRARVQLQPAQQLVAERVNRTRREPDYGVGDRVMLQSFWLKWPGVDLLGKHLKPPYVGPYKVLKFNRSKTAVHLEWLNPRTRLHHVQPVDRCRLYVPDLQQTRARQVIEPPTLVSDSGNIIDEIEKIVGHKTQRGRKKYLVKWLGYDSNHNTWESYQHLVNEGCEESIDDYEATRRLRGGASTLLTMTTGI